MTRKKTTNYRKKSWNSLTDLHDYLVRTKAEEILDFNGLFLTTDKGVYGLAIGKLSFQEKEVKKKRSSKKK